MNVYDFDKTIYSIDSTCDFYIKMLIKNPILLRFTPLQLWGIIGYKLGVHDKKKMKEDFYIYLTGIKNVEEEVEKYWDKNIGRMNSYYLDQQKPDDLVISASATYMIAPAMRRLNIQNYIGTDVDTKTGKLYSAHCKGAQKVVAYKEAGYKLEDMEEFYSDSYSDVYLAREAKKAFLIKNGKVTDWDKF